MVKLSKNAATLGIAVGSSDAFIIETATDEKVQRAEWAVKDVKGRKLNLPRFTGQPKYKGARVESDKDGLYVRAGDVSSYVELNIECDVTVKSKKGAPKTSKLKAKVEFIDHWGGMAKAWFPYPDDYEFGWNSDKPGRRAVALLHEMIGLLPEPFLRAAGSIPIVRARNATSWRGGNEYRGAHLPFLFDTIQINNKLITQLKNSPTVTKEDVEFCVVVLHEMAHAATYRNCLWGTHHAMASLRKFLRKPVAPVITWWPGAVLTLPVTLAALVQQVVAPRDIVSDFSEVAGWELTSWLARVVRTVQLPVAIVDLGQWLWRIPSQGLNQDYPIRPNVVVGNAEFGAAFGLRCRFTESERKAYDEALAAYEEARVAWEAAAPAAKPAAQKKRDAAWKKFQKASDALKATGAAAGFVSNYATSDALEDMAETLAFFLFDKKQLGMIREYFGDLSNKRLKDKRKFFTDNNYLPRPGTFRPAVLGSLWQGLEELPYLDRRYVEL